MKRRNLIAGCWLAAILAVEVTAAQEPAVTDPAPAGEEATTVPAAEPDEPAAEELNEGGTGAEPLPPEEELAIDEVFE